MAETIFTKLVKSSSLLVKLLIQFLNSFSNILQRVLLHVRYITFGELQSIYEVSFGTAQSNIFLLDVLIT